MKKLLKGKVLSTKMVKTVVVQVVSKKPHPLYKKLLKRSKNYNVDTANMVVNVGDEVLIEPTRPMGTNKNFKIHEIVSGGKK
jgi:small subunit ribosomal protein S17